jgi:hypothetical protein
MPFCFNHAEKKWKKRGTDPPGESSPPAGGDFHECKIVDGATQAQFTGRNALP